MGDVTRAYNGKVACWTKPGSGDPLAPFDDPSAYADLVKFHSDFQYLSNNARHDSISVTHTLLAGATGSGYSASNGSASSGTSGNVFNGQVRVSSINLVAHGEASAPMYLVMYGDEIVSGATCVQNDDGGTRLISSYADDTYIGLQETAISTTEDLVSVSRDYTVFVFRDLAADPDLPTLHVKSSDGTFILGKGKVTQDQHPIRRLASGETGGFYIPKTPTVDVHNGSIRTINVAGETTDYGLYTGALFTLDAIKVTF